jgi:hypothetical protein
MGIAMPNTEKKSWFNQAKMRKGVAYGEYFQPTLQPTVRAVLCGFRVFWQSPRSCKLL